MPRSRALARLSLLLLVPVLALSGLGSPASDAPFAPTGNTAHARVLAEAYPGAMSWRPGDATATPAATPTAEARRTPDATPKPRATPKPKTTPKPEATPKPKTTPKPAAPAEARPKRKKAVAAAAPAPARAVTPRSLYLAIGHGRTPEGRRDPGAEHPGTGALEIDAAQIMVDAMTKVLRDAPGVELIVESGDHPNVVGSVAAANAAGVDDCIEVHQDTAAAPPGAFAHWYAGASSAQRLADRMIAAMRDEGLQTRTDWHRARSGLYWVRKTTCRAVLLEIGRVGDFSSDQLRAFGRRLARAYLRDTKAARGITG